MAQRQARARARDDEQVEDVPTEVAEQSADVVEEACCVLDSIDDALEAAEPTDQEIYDRGRPDFNAFFDDEEYERLVDEEGQQAASAYYEACWDEWRGPYDRYVAAYQAVTGTRYSPCGCGDEDLT